MANVTTSEETWNMVGILAKAGIKGRGIKQIPELRAQDMQKNRGHSMNQKPLMRPHEQS